MTSLNTSAHINRRLNNMSEIYNGIEALQKERNMKSLISQFIDKAVIECPYATKDQINKMNTNKKLKL